MKVLKKLNNGLYQIPYYSSSNNNNNTVPEIPSSPFQQPIVTDDPNYLQGYLNTLIGEYIKVEFILGTNMFIDKEGILEKVGVDHIVLRMPKTGDTMIADLYSIKFVEVFE